uniref:Nuclear factor, interleukin 3 regulated, member 4 n=1 Tax=Myripristis murdjan TaxID=586833 RepID=A0A667XK38_9TELE
QIKGYNQKRQHQGSHLQHAEKNMLLQGKRRKREFTPEERKDALYWEKRRKNNEAAKRSREKRRMSDYMLETHFLALKEENARLNAELLAIKIHFGLLHPTVYTAHQSNHLQLHARDSTQSIRTYRQPLQREYCGGTDLSFLPSQQHPTVQPGLLDPALMPTYPLRGYSYLNMPGRAGSGLLTPILIPPNLLPAHSSYPGTSLLRPEPTLLRPDYERGTSNEEEEQQVPGAFSVSYAALPHKKTSKRDTGYSTPSQNMSDETETN